MEAFIEVQDFFIDLESPHKLGERSKTGSEATKWINTGRVWSSCKNSQIKDVIEPGVYNVFQDRDGATHAQAFDVKTDELYFLPNDHTIQVCKEIAEFWNKAEKFKQHNVKHKRGILFMGPPGTGKTSLINLLTDAVVKNGGVVFHVTSINELYWYIEFVHQHLRVIHPDMPVITVLEDIDKYMDGGSNESGILNFLDGSDSFDHHVVVGTTNRLDGLNDLIVRPSRFDWLVTVDLPDEACRKEFLTRKGLEEQEAVEWAKQTNGYSMADLKELYISVKLLDLSLKESKAKLEEQGKIDVKRSFAKRTKTKVGF